MTEQDADSDPAESGEPAGSQDDMPDAAAGEAAADAESDTAAADDPNPTEAEDEATDPAQDDLVDDDVDPDDAAAELEEIAERPAGHIEQELSAIVGGDDAESETDSSDHRIDPESLHVPEELIEDIAATSAETVASAIAMLREEIDHLEAELDEQRDRAEGLESRLKRKQADFQNYKKRQKKRLEEEKERATEELVTRLLDVRDNLQRALDQDEGVDIRDGVQTTLDQFDQQLDRENVEPIEPDVGASVDPQRHEVLATVESGEPEDAIALVHRPGYEMADKVLRPAQVAVSDGTGSTTAADDEEEAAADETDTEDEKEDKEDQAEGAGNSSHEGASEGENDTADAGEAGDDETDPTESDSEDATDAESGSSEADADDVADGGSEA